MKAAKNYMDKRGGQIISFQDGEPHTVKLVDAEEDTVPAQNSDEEVEGVRFKVKEDGEDKNFFTASFKLISELAGREPGEVVTIQMKKTKNDDGEWRSIYQIEEESSGYKRNPQPNGTDTGTPPPETPPPEM